MDTLLVKYDEKRPFLYNFFLILWYILAGGQTLATRLVAGDLGPKLLLLPSSLAYPGTFLLLVLIYAPYVFAGMFVCDLYFLPSYILTSSLTHHRSFERIFFHLVFTTRKSIDIMIINVFLSTSERDRRELKC